MSAKKDLKRLAEYLDLTDGVNPVDYVIRLLNEPMMAAAAPDVTIKCNPVIPERLVLVASTKAKQGQQPWSEWATDLHATVDSLMERVKTAERTAPGLQFEIMEVEVIRRVAIETEVRAVDVT